MKTVGYLTLDADHLQVHIDEDEDETVLDAFEFYRRLVDAKEDNSWLAPFVETSIIHQLIVLMPYL